MLIKNALARTDPRRESNIKHCTANELTDDKNKRKKKRYRVSPSKAVMKYQDGQYEQIFKKANDK